MERAFQTSDFSERTRTLMEKALKEARSFQTPEIDTGIIAIATLDDKQIRQLFQLKVDLAQLRTQLSDIAGYQPEDISNRKITYTPAVFSLFDYARQLRKSESLTQITPGIIYKAIHNEEVGGLGNILFRRAGIYLPQ